MMGRVTATFRFRIEVRDQPGALARVTDVLASTGGNVESLDMHQPHGGMSIDEIAVSAEDAWDYVAVGEALSALAGVTVLALRRDRHPGDPVVNALRWARVMLVNDPSQHELELQRAICEVTGAAIAWTRPAAQAQSEPIAFDAMTGKCPVIRRIDALPEDMTTELVPPYWLLAAADDRDDPVLVAFAARPIETPFSASETARLVALLQLRRSIAALVPWDAPAPT